MTGISRFGLRRRSSEARAEGHVTWEGEFGPRRYIRQGHVQTLLARRAPADSVAQRMEQPMLLDAGPDESGYDPERPVRLLGYYNPPLSPATHRGLVHVLHGWHGSSHSSDALYIADALLSAGYSVFRPNMRDHGPNRHFDKYALNKGFFLGTLLNEMATLIRTASLLAGDRPVSIVGGSMGGNFALRLAALHAQQPIPNLARVIAICPAVNPAAAVAAIDGTAGFRQFFRSRMVQALQAKQARFPELYDFAGISRMRTIQGITEHLVARYTTYGSAQNYYNRYTVTPETLAGLNVPTTLIAARDDKAIPVKDILAFSSGPMLQVQVHATGGHMGFVDLFPYRRWLPSTVLSELERRG